MFIHIYDTDISQMLSELYYVAIKLSTRILPYPTRSDVPSVELRLMCYARYFLDNIQRMYLAYRLGQKFQ